MHSRITQRKNIMTIEYIKITHAGRDSRLIVGFTYILERLDNGLLRISSVGGKFSTLINPDTSDVEFEYTTETRGPSTAWRNPYAAKLWSEVYIQSIVDSYSPEGAAERADQAAALFNERWRGDDFTNVGVAA